MRRKISKKDSVVSITIFTLIVIIITSILSILGLEGQQTIIAANGTLETYLITTNNILSVEGIKYIFGEAINNFINFKPLTYFVVSLIGISIAESSGLLSYIASKLRRLKFKYLTMLVILISLLFTFIGDYSFVYLIPIVAAIYKKIGKNPILGIITVFLSLTMGYSLGIVSNYNDYFLGTMTQVSARLEVDKNFVFNLSSNLYINLFSSIIFIIVTTYFIENKLALKFSNPEIEENEYKASQKANEYTFITLMVLILLTAILIVPNVPYLGWLLDTEATTYMDKLFGENSAFGKGLPYIITIVMIICSYVYGKISGNIKKNFDYTKGLSVSFEKTGPLFILMFFISQLIGILEWTNVGNVITTNLLDFMSGLEFSGIPLIFVSFILIVIMTLLIPSSVDKWVLLSPVIVPLFMRSNITPNYTQFLFGLADGIGKALTPIFPYYIIMIGLIEKYKDKEDLNFLEVMKMLLPTILIVSGILLLILIGWFLIGLPLGIGSFSSL